MDAWNPLVCEVEGRAELVRPVLGVRTDVIPADRREPLCLDPSMDLFTPFGGVICILKEINPGSMHILPTFKFSSTDLPAIAIAYDFHVISLIAFDTTVRSSPHTCAIAE